MRFRFGLQPFRLRLASARVVVARQPEISIEEVLMRFRPKFGIAADARQPDEQMRRPQIRTQ
jgi:hypothetical protein